MRVAHQRLEGVPALDGGDRGAVLGRDVGPEADQPAAAGAGHVLHDDRRVAGQMLAEMAPEQPRISIVGTARTGADIEVDVLAFEILRGRSTRRGGSKQNGRADGEGSSHRTAYALSAFAAIKSRARSSPLSRGRRATHRATHAGLWNMGPRFRGDDPCMC